MGYHTKEIKKGILGEVSKITEEYEEFLDASEQQDKILQLCELSDLIGAIDSYIKKFNISIEDLIDFSRKTQESFIEGKRK